MNNLMIRFAEDQGLVVREYCTEELTKTLTVSPGWISTKVYQNSDKDNLYFDVSKGLYYKNKVSCSQEELASILSFNMFEKMKSIDGHLNFIHNYFIFTFVFGVVIGLIWILILLN